MGETFSKSFERSALGYSLHKMIVDDEGKSIDYRFIEVNDAFLEMTGLPKSIVGQRIKEAIPEIIYDSTNWIRIYSEVAFNQKPISLERYSEALSNWYMVNAHSPEEGYFVTILTPIPEAKTTIMTDSQLKQNYYRNESLVRILAYQSSNFEDFLEYALEEAIKLSQSDIGYIYLYNEDTKKIKLNSWSKKVMEDCSVAAKQTTYMLEKTGFLGEVIRQKKAIINNKFREDHPIKKGFPEGHVSLDKFMSMPIHDKGKIVAVIGLGNKIDDYSDNDILQIQEFMEEVWNIAKRKQAEDALANEKEQLKMTLESIGEGVISVDKNNRIISANGLIYELTSLYQGNIIGEIIFPVLRNIDNDLARFIKQCVEDENISNQMFEREIFTISHNGNEKIISVRVSPVYDNSLMNGFVLAIRDITIEYKHSERIEYMSYHDSLTGLYNRRYVEEEIKRRDTKRQLPMTIIIGDVNGLKLTNDAFGHLNGDVLLISVAKVLKDTCRQEDVVARWGGDEFLILLPQTRLFEGKEIIKRINQKCEEEKNSIINLSISLGCAVKEDESQEIEEVIKEAEDQMYRHKLSESRSQRSSIIETIRNSLYERNNETEEHAEKLIHYCMLIANRMNLSKSEKSDLKLLAALHDIGKIGIPDNILLKPGPLSKDEWYEMRKHPIIGYRIAQASPELVQISKNILHHHERWDGTGYPGHMDNKNIPILSRIIAVADAYDAMISNRPYRIALSHETAKNELLQHKETQFDPNIVDVFLEEINKELNDNN